MNLNCSLICTVLRTLNCTNWNIIRFTGQDIGLKDCWRSTIGKLSAYFRVTGQVRSNTIISKFITRTQKQIKRNQFSPNSFFSQKRREISKIATTMLVEFWNWSFDYIDVEHSWRQFVLVFIHGIHIHELFHNRSIKITTFVKDSRQISKTHIYEGMNLYLLSSI